MLIRELDGLFDLLSHGSWVWFALLTTVGSLLAPLRHLPQTLSQLAEYTRTPYYGMMISGLLAILVFSRLFGMHGLWYAVLDENYAPGGEKHGRGRQRVVWLYAVPDRHPRLRLLLPRPRATDPVAAALTVDDNHRRTRLPAVARRRVNREFSTSV
ncbi:putative transport protein [Klebsiella variicola]|nr:putative transport protein [Klebsiella variicola]